MDAGRRSGRAAVSVGDNMIKQTDKKKRGAASRSKGARGERLLAQKLKGYGFDVHRGFTFHHESDVVGLDGIHCEVKRVEKLNIHKAMAQAVEESEKREDGMPTVFFKRDREEWLVCMRLPDWIKLYKTWIGGCNGGTPDVCEDDN